MAGPGEHLEEVNKHIAAFKVRVADQEAQVAEHERDHHPAEAAKRQLERLRRALQQAEALRNMILRELSRGG